MTQKLSIHDTVMSLFETRQEAFTETSIQILDELYPTVLVPLCKHMFLCEEEAVDWVDISLIDSAVIVTCDIYYSSPDHIPAIINQLVPTAEDEYDVVEGQIRRTVRIGIPLYVLKCTPDEIIDYIQKTTRMLVPDQHQASGYDYSQLTKDQIFSLMYNALQYTGTKQQ